MPIVLAVFFLSSAGLASWAYLTQFRPDQQTDAAAAAATIKAASDGSIALLSYSPDSLDKDFAAAKTHLTGEFLDYYTQFTHDIVTPAAQQKAVKTSATVVPFGGLRSEPGFGRGAAVPEPDHHQQGESRRLVHREQREGGSDQGERRLAYLRIRPGVVPASALVGPLVQNRSMVPSSKRADLVLSGGGVKGVGLVGAVVALMDAAARHSECRVPRRVRSSAR